MEIKQKIEQWVSEAIEGLPYFIVEIQISKGRKSKVEVIIDGEGGVNIDDCAKISRFVGNALEEGDCMEGAYDLMVASPGVGSPFKLRKQYAVNVGRHLEVTFADGKTKEGLLDEVGEHHIVLLNKKNPKNKASKEMSPVEVKFEDIKQAVVVAKL